MTTEPKTGFRFFTLTLLFFLFLTSPVFGYIDGVEENDIHIFASVGHTNIDFEDENPTLFSYSDCISKHGRGKCEVVSLAVFFNWSVEDWIYETSIYNSYVTPIATLQILYQDGTPYREVLSPDLEFVPNASYRFGENDYGEIFYNETSGNAIINLRIEGINYADLDGKFISITTGAVEFGGYAGIERLGGGTFNVTSAGQTIILTEPDLHIIDNYPNGTFFDSDVFWIWLTYNYSFYNELKRDTVQIYRNGLLEYSHTKYNQTNFTYLVQNNEVGDTIELYVNITGQGVAGSKGTSFYKFFVRGNVSTVTDIFTGEEVNITAPVLYDFSVGSEWNFVNCYLSYVEEGQQDNYGGGCLSKMFKTGDQFCVYAEPGYEDFTSYSVVEVSGYFNNRSWAIDCTHVCIQLGTTTLCLQGQAGCDGLSTGWMSILGGYASCFTLPLNQTGDELSIVFNKMCGYSEFGQPVGLMNNSINISLNRMVSTIKGYVVTTAYNQSMEYKHEFTDSNRFIYNFSENTGIIEIYGNVTRVNGSNITEFLDTDIESGGYNWSSYYSPFEQRFHIKKGDEKFQSCDNRTFYRENYTDEMVNTATISFDIFRIENDKRVDFTNYNSTLYTSEFLERKIPVGYNLFSIIYDVGVNDYIQVQFFSEGLLTRQSDKVYITANETKTIRINTYEINPATEFNTIHFKVYNEDNEPLNDIEINIISDNEYFNSGLFAKMVTTNIFGYAELIVPFENYINYSISEDGYDLLSEEYQIVKGSQLVEIILTQGGLYNTPDGKARYAWFEELFADYGIDRIIIGLVIVVAIMIYVANETKHTSASGYLSFVAGLLTCVGLTGTLFPVEMTLFIIIIISALLTWQFKQQLIDRVKSHEE